MKYLVKTSLLTFFCMILASFCPYAENSRLMWFIVLLLVLFGGVSPEQQVSQRAAFI